MGTIRRWRAEAIEIAVAVNADSVSGNGFDGDGDVALATLDGTSWALVDGEDITIPDGETLTIAFAAARISGSSGCNRFTGMYQEDGDSISVGPLAATRMACADEIMTAERVYLAALENVSSWLATAAELKLSNQMAERLLRYEANSA